MSENNEKDNEGMFFLSPGIRSVIRDVISGATEPGSRFEISMTSSLFTSCESFFKELLPKGITANIADVYRIVYMDWISNYHLVSFIPMLTLNASIVLGDSRHPWINTHV
ncbi:6398_t:CDS:2 [Funneliformis geosporum]|uniref:18448_t:CDS:1 n=1 Tax=Funneliformis geosporum TaxID=1117311 RepID=A0A9W4WYE4_9GLOM|nr:6398_t:CDS:2 [Funneliformis geosporum]CAI2188410.1 18448_t:CDS:2 [Funneliformis geosporum]